MGATEAYITLEEAARLEGVSYETTKKRAQRGKLETRNETRESGGKDITLVKVNSLSKQARNAYREQERLKALAADSSDIQEEQKTEQPWYVDTDIDWYMEQYKERFYQAAELGNVVRQYLRETVGRYGDITAFAEEYAQKHLGKGYRTLYRMIKAYNEALFWQDKKEKEEGCSYEYFRVLCLCRKPKDVGKFPSISAEVQQTIKNIWFDKDFAGNRGTKQMLYEQLEAIAEMKQWKKMPSYQTVARFISFLMEDEGMKNAHFLVANGTREYKNKVMCKRRRDTTSLQVMEMIQGDEHTFDCWVTYKAPNGNIVPIRPKLVCWIDTRSRMILGDVMCKDADSQTLKASLLKLIYHDAGSVPRYLYIDNGKDYTSKEMLGVDRKYRHDQAEKDKHFAVAFDDMARGFYRSLGIEDVHISMPYEPWTKGQIERFFGTVCRKFTKWVTSYTGTLTGSLTADKVNKDIKEMAKQGKLMTLEEFYEQWTKWKNEKYATRVHSELRKAGEEYTRPGDLFEKGDRYEMAPPPKSQATILMMKSEDARVRNTGIERNGFYYNDQELIAHIGEKVDVKYDPDDVSVIYVYDKKGRPICSAESYDLLQFGKVSDETLKQHRRQQNAQLRRDRKIAEEASIPFEKLNEQQQNADKVIGSVSLKMEASKKASQQGHSDATGQNLETDGITAEAGDAGTPGTSELRIHEQPGTESPGTSKKDKGGVDERKAFYRSLPAGQTDHLGRPAPGGDRNSHPHDAPGASGGCAERE